MKNCKQCNDTIPLGPHGLWKPHWKKYQKREFCSKGCASRYAGYNRSEEWRKKVSESKIGENNPHYGIPQTHPNSLKALHKKWEGHTKPEQSAFQKYKAEVWSVTRKQPLHTLPNIEKRGRNEWDLDHIYSMWDGYHNDVPPEMIGDIRNLRVITASENRTKHIRSDMTKEELYALFG
jgi:hypothetical protein